MVLNSCEVTQWNGEPENSPKRIRRRRFGSGSFSGLSISLTSAQKAEEQ
jgi:hypothetical protein